MSDKFTDFKNDLPDYVRTEQDFELYCMRHSSEHVLTQAMLDIYGKDKVIMAMGPATAEGFYFDFELREGEINESDFERIETRMEEIKAEKQIINRKEISLEHAKELFKNNSYKMEWLEQIKEAGEKVSLRIRR